MKGFKNLAICLAVMSLTACSELGIEEEDDATNNEFRFELITIDQSQRPRVILEGAQIDPKHLTFSIKDSQYDNGSLSYENTHFPHTLDNAINSRLKDWAMGAGTKSDIAISANITSDNTDVVSYENGKLIGKAPGKANLTITLDTTVPISSVFDTSDVNFTGFQGTYEFGEVVVCPYTDIDLVVAMDGSDPISGVYYSGQRVITDEKADFEGLSYARTEGDTFSNIATNIQATPKVDMTLLDQYGLSVEECTPLGTDNDLLISAGLSPYINHKTNMDRLFPAHEPGTVSGISLLGLSFPNITMSLVSEISNPEITEAGYGGNLVLNATNPIKIKAQSSELGREIDVTHFYVGQYQYGGFNNSGLDINANTICDDKGNYCVDQNANAHAISLSSALFPTLTTNELPVVPGIQDFSLSHTSGLPGSTVTISSTLLVEGALYDTSSFVSLNTYSDIQFTGIQINNYNPTHSTISGNTFSTLSEGIIQFHTPNDYERSVITYTTGPATDAAIQGRWLQVDTGQDHYIPAHSPTSYSVINDNQLTYQDTENKTAKLIRAGINNVAVSGSVNIIEEEAASAQASGLSFPAAANDSKFQARGLSGTAGIDLILKNVNTGEETDVTVDDSGDFNEEVPTGVYDVDGIVKDGEVTYVINTQITVEKDATDTGKLNLAKVGLYNFDISVSGCEYDYKCYAGQQYTFTITAKNTGFIASSAVEAVITDISAHENVTHFNITSNPTTGAARGDAISYTFTARFNQPAQDTVIEIPITLTDADNRTWEDVVKINLSQYASTNVNILAYNDGAAASVRGYLMLEGRTPIRVDGSSNTIKVPNKPGASYELILANQEYNQETPYAVSFNKTTTQQAISDATGIVGKNENADDVATGATVLVPDEHNIAYISAGDVDYYLINIPDAP